MNETIRNAVREYYPDIEFDQLTFWLGAARNTASFQVPDIEARLRYHGMEHVLCNDYTVDEEWMPSSDMSSPVERIADRMVTQYTPDELRHLNDSLIPLTLDELKMIESKYPNITIIRRFT